MRISLIQMSVQLGKVEVNTEKVHNMVQAAADADLVVLPELWCCGYDYHHLKKHAKKTPELLEKLAVLAKGNVLYLVTGSLPELHEGNIYNTSYLINSQGKQVGKYRKIHLFPTLDEDKNFQAGDMIVPFDTSLGKIGLLICFDLRFPELARTYSAFETKLVIVPAQWPSERIEHWRLFLQARALENQIYMVGVNRVGKSDNVQFGGNSMVVDPNGYIIASGGTKEKIIRADIELQNVNLIRKEFPVWRSRRRNLYHINFCFPLQDEQSDPQSE